MSDFTKAELQVDLVSFTPNPEHMVYAAFKQCYSPQNARDILWESEFVLMGEEGSRKEAIKRVREFIKEKMNSGHLSPLEHVSFTFAISGISRALSHQLVRHRIASYSQQSQRYVSAEDARFVLPPSIAAIPEAAEVYGELIEKVQESYSKILSIFDSNGVTGSAAREDARYVLPQATETKIVMTMNAHALLNFFKKRLCLRAQWEIRAMAEMMRKCCRLVAPAIFADADAPCVSLGYCPESKKFSCGRFPVFEK